MLLFPTYDYQSSPATTTMASSKFKGPKPKGLSRMVRGTWNPGLANPLTNTIVVDTPFNDVDSDTREENISSGNVSDSSSTSSKRRRTSPSPRPPPSEEIRVVPVIIFWDYSHICPNRPNKWKMGAKFQDTSPIAGPGQDPSNQAPFNLEDWEDLRDLATEAKNTYDDHDLPKAIQMLRAVVHESHRCLKLYPDPSVVFAAPLHKKKAEPPPPPPPVLPLIREWYNDPEVSASRRGPGQPPAFLRPPSPPPEKEECPCVDLPTAFHTVLGTALFTFGCIMDSDPSLALQGEPNTPTPYWLAAIDVFESGESLPIRTSGRIPKSMPEDWRLNASWGRTLIKLAAELLRRRKENPALREPPPMPDYSNFKVPKPSLPTPFRTYTADEPEWPRASLFSTISFLRPPFTRRLSLDTLSPDEIMTFAEDHLSRAIFHMPRNVVATRYPHHPTASSTSAPSPPPSFEIERAGLNRPQEIYSMASEMLLVAEKSETSTGRLRWARWADGVISQLTIEPNMRPQHLGLRARCNLAMGMAKMEELLAEWDYPNSLYTDDAEDGREYFKNAATFFEQAIALVEEDIEEIEKDAMEFDSDDEGEEGGSVKASASGHISDEHDLHRMKVLSSEALIKLGDLTADVAAREELYAEAKRVGKKKTVLYDEHGLDETGDNIYDEDSMDETD